MKLYLKKSLKDQANTSIYERDGRPKNKLDGFFSVSSTMYLEAQLFWI